eukprot:CAMPEP_0170307514 /NCGR_PEP_ID=MMETSP0116_2-20130129/54177_1 /TAXON_ID=400756 /ORGANISM="Durinskia baltica, Strain CSIRO CS-38" /LENGTH=52 /DNA_ID=CAMNT_0010559657 /DNA_START=39 /DNA_END=194 /DNA_ORIENTATION=-
MIEPGARPGLARGARGVLEKHLGLGASGRRPPGRATGGRPGGEGRPLRAFPP